ncbi:hypothetical protein [Mycobacterium hackensackense]|uniref:hypothetical protein n=1 Tax=Mycobacterium hackensackense TaxID=228909 RepID=UPI002265B66D|nr:hypothetical protein [Mycobacterium hackensackense]
MSIWLWNEQVTYRAILHPDGWWLKRWILGAADKRGVEVFAAMGSLQEAKDAAERDLPTALM